MRTGAFKVAQRGEFAGHISLSPATTLHEIRRIRRHRDLIDTWWGEKVPRALSSHGRVSRRLVDSCGPRAATSATGRTAVHLAELVHAGGAGPIELVICDLAVFAIFLILLHWLFLCRKLTSFVDMSTGQGMDNAVAVATSWTRTLVLIPASTDR